MRKMYCVQRTQKTLIFFFLAKPIKKIRLEHGFKQLEISFLVFFFFLENCSSVSKCVPNYSHRKYFKNCGFFAQSNLNNLHKFQTILLKSFKIIDNKHINVDFIFVTLAARENKLHLYYTNYQFILVSAQNFSLFLL